MIRFTCLSSVLVDHQLEERWRWDRRVVGNPGQETMYMLYTCPLYIDSGWTEIHVDTRTRLRDLDCR